MKTLLILAALLAVPVAVQAQGATTATPDCQISLSAAAAATSVIYHNTKSCTFWTLAYNSAGFSAVSIEPEYAPDGATSNVAGTFLVWPSNQLASGSLPLTVATESQISTFGYHPWVRINFISKTGSGLIVATLNGWRTAPGDASSAGGTAITCAACATSANQTNGTQQTKVVDGSGNVLPTLPSGAVTAANSDSVVCATDTGCNPQALTTGSAILTYATTGGLTVVTVASGAHQIYGVSVDDGINTADVWVNLYDSTTATAGSTAPKMFWKIPGGTAPTGGGNDPVMPPMGVPFATGIQWFCSITNAGGASAAPLACGLNLQYK